MTDAVLQVQGLCKQFGALVASDHIDLELRAGEIHALIGPNGAGKSTLIKQLCGELRPDSGRVWLGGRDISALSVAARARCGLARSFQVSCLALQDTVLQNAVLGALGQSGGGLGLFRRVLHNGPLLQRARWALEQVGLSAQAHQRAAELSHGQRRQLEIAVALSLEPKLFLMDEPMAGLGPEGSEQMTQVLDQLRTRAPILLVEHDMDAVFRLADRISVLVYGKLIATGTAAQIKADAQVRRAYLGEAD